ncbi:BnaCnng10190D [Brassica napus]|uniref:BnaCnng10190D protein n=1 Tax=Brassica napus TaxID=3708 RepID=A0A078HXA6_BRANA|nr:BnaCnng10190D [Brassica napus]
MVVEDKAGPNKMMAVLNRGENRVVVVGLEEEEEGDSEEVSAEVETNQVEMEEDARLNLLAGRETIKKTPLGRATTRVVDQTGKKETNAGGAWGTAAWGTANDQENAGNNNDGWGKKPSDDVKTSGEADNAWGGKTNAGASSSSGSAW